MNERKKNQIIGDEAFKYAHTEDNGIATDMEGIRVEIHGEIEGAFYDGAAFGHSLAEERMEELKEAIKEALWLLRRLSESFEVKLYRKMYEEWELGAESLLNETEKTQNDEK